MTNPSYFDRYENLAFSRDDNGVLTMRFHTNGGPIIFTGQTHEDLPLRPGGHRRRRGQPSDDPYRHGRRVHGPD